MHGQPHIRFIRMLCRTCWLCTKLWDAIWIWKSTFWSPTGIFPQEISAKSVKNTVKDFTKTFWLWKSGTKASGPQVCWQTVVGHWRGIYLTPNIGKSHTTVHFREKLLPVSWACKVLFCTFKFHCIFETLPDRKILHIHVSEFSIKSTAKFSYWGSWDIKVKILTRVIQYNA